MSSKDWILLLVPILCNGVVVFLLQRAFEKKQLALTEKYKYVSIMQQKVDDSLALFTKVLQTSGEDLIQINWLNKFIASYCDVFYYYQQNKQLFKSLDNRMNKLIKTHEHIISIQSKGDNVENIPSTEIIMESLFRETYELLQAIQNDCMQRKI